MSLRDAAPSGNEVNDLTPLEAALRYARAGRLVLPLIPRQKRPLVKWSREAMDEGYVPDERTIRRWWSRWPDAGVGMRTDGLLVLDADLPHGLASLETLKQRLGPLPRTKIIVSGSGGRQFLFRVPRKAAERIPQAQRLLDLPNLDVRVHTRGIIALPPTLHRSGERYRWLRFNTAAKDLPTGWLNALVPPPRPRPATPPPRVIAAHSTERGRRILDSELTALRRAVEAGGGRSNGLYASAARMGQVVVTGELEEQETLDALIGVGLSLGLPERKAVREATSGLRWGIDNPRETRP